MKFIGELLNWLKRLRREGVLELLGVLWIILTVGAVSIFLLEYQSEQRNIISIFDAFYWAWVTMTTVGFGDLTPTTTSARIVASVMMFFSLALISFFTATISSIFVARKIREGKGLEKINYNNHYIICGWNDQAPQILQTLVEHLGESKTPLILVNELSEDEIDTMRTQFKPLHVGFVRGDFSRDDILEKASITKAKAVLILPNLARVTPEAADEKTALATYSIKTHAPKTKVYAYLLDRNNKPNLKRANADGIIVSDEFGPFLGATQIHTPGIPAFFSELMGAGNKYISSKPVPAEMVGKTFGELFTWMHEEENQTVLGIFSEEQSAGLSDFLSSDSGDYLDKFIQAKLQAAGRGVKDEQKIKVRINPDKDYVLHANEYMILLQ